MGIFKKPRIKFPLSALDVKGINDFFETIMFKVFGNIDFADLGKKLQNELKYTGASIKLMESEIVAKTTDAQGNQTMTLRPSATEFSFNAITGESNKVTISVNGIDIQNGSLTAPTINGGTINGEVFNVNSNIALKPPESLGFGFGSGEIRFYRSETEYVTMKYGAPGNTTFVTLNGNFKAVIIHANTITADGQINCRTISCEFPPWADENHSHSGYASSGHSHSDLEARISALESASP